MDGIWIRSQDRKTLIKCKEIWVEGNKIYGSASGEEAYVALGEYSDSNRALGLLDYIESNIIDCSLNTTYRMPKE